MSLDPKGPRPAQDAPYDQGHESAVAATLARARDILLQEGPAKTLEYLKESPQVGAEGTIRVMHALVWNHQKKLPSNLLEEPFLDAIWCQCTVCEHVWLISPIQRLIAGPGGRGREAGLACTSCGRVLCQACSRAALGDCPCGAAFSAVQKPNGRKRPQVKRAESERYWDRPPADRPNDAAQDLHLYFGFEGRLPIGVDASFPAVQTGTAEDHLRWAETLADAGVFYQAQQQLDLLSERAASCAKALWLRARLELVQYRNARERSRRHLDTDLSIPDWWSIPGRIKERLEQATTQLPDHAGAWLLAAEVALDLEGDADYARAVHCAQRARELLGDTPAVLLQLGRALRGAQLPADAAAVLSRIPKDTPERSASRSELFRAQLEARCQANPLDVEAHLNLGRWCIRHDQRDRAQAIFARLVERCPDRAEGYYGLAQLAFVGHARSQSQEERYREAHQLCLQALNHNRDFGLAHELLGSIFRNRPSASNQGDFPAEDPLPYYQRALELDPTCDTAMWILAEHHLNRGELQPALGLLERAAELESPNSSVYFLLAAIYKGQRQYEREDWASRKAKELSPHTVLSSDYENKILRLCDFEF